MFKEPEPPFPDGSDVKCIKIAPEIGLDGRLIDICRCIKDQIYDIDYCAWSSKAGWMVAISGELHAAENFVLIEK